MDEPVLADVEVAAAGAAPPVVRFPVHQVVLEAADSRVEILEDLPRPADRGRHGVVHLTLRRTERLEPA